MQKSKLSASLAVLALVLASAPLAAAAEKPAAASSEAKALAATIAAVDIPYERFQLGNGLTVLVHTDRKAPIVGVTTYYRVGSKNERSEEHTSELQSLMRNSYAVFCLKKKTREQ